MLQHDRAHTKGAAPPGSSFVVLPATPTEEETRTFQLPIRGTSTMMDVTVRTINMGQIVVVLDPSRPNDSIIEVSGMPTGITVGSVLADMTAQGRDAYTVPISPPSVRWSPTTGMRIAVDAEIVTFVRPGVNLKGKMKHTEAPNFAPDGTPLRAEKTLGEHEVIDHGFDLLVSGGGGFVERALTTGWVSTSPNGRTFVLGGNVVLPAEFATASAPTAGTVEVTGQMGEYLRDLMMLDTNIARHGPAADPMKPIGGVAPAPPRPPWQ